MLLVLISVAVELASAHPQSKTDANDSPGTLDISKLRFGHGQKRIQVRVSMFDRWPSSVLRGGSSRYVRVDLDPSGGSDDYGYYVFIKYRRGRLVASVRRVNTDFSYTRVGKTRVSRPSRKSVLTSVRRRLIHADSGRLRWSAQANDGRAYDRTRGFQHRL
jgi:hypothetical protein